MKQESVLTAAKVAFRRPIKVIPLKADMDYRRKDKKMLLDKKKKLAVLGVICMIPGIALIIYGNYILVGLPVLGGLMTFAGGVMLFWGTKEDDVIAPDKPVAEVKKAAPAKKPEKPARLLGYVDHEGIYHGV